jgi:hypothetical protein
MADAASRDFDENLVGHRHGVGDVAQGQRLFVTFNDGSFHLFYKTDWSASVLACKRRECVVTPSLYTQQAW